MIVLINPRYQVSSQPPLGLAYLSAYLKKQGHDNVQIIDTTYEQLESRLDSISSPTLFGMYFMTPYYAGVIKAIGVLKKRFPDVPIIAGGPHPTVNPEDVLKRLQVSVCVRGEGEYTMAELVDAFKERSDLTNLSGIRGISYFDPARNEIVHNEDREPIQDLDEIPFPRRELLPMDHYVQGGTQKGFSYRKLRVTTMITSRGCPFNCSYCQPTVNRIFGKKARFRSVNNVVEEIGQLIRDYSIQGILFSDDTFTCKKKFVMEFCEEILRKKYDIKFAINSRVNTIDDEMLSMLKKAGVETIMFGIESGNQKILDNVRKNITIEQIQNAVTMTKSKDINVYGYFMIGSTEESSDTLKDTFSLVRRLPFDEVQFSMATPYRGTYLFDEASSLDLIPDLSAMEQKGYYSSVAMRSRHLTGNEIKRYYRLFDLYSKYKSIRCILRNPAVIPPIIVNKLFPKLFNR